MSIAPFGKPYRRKDKNCYYFIMLLPELFMFCSA